MTILYDNKKASRAIAVFEKLCEEENRKYIGGSCKGLVVATIMAYKKHFTYEEIKEVAGDCNEARSTFETTGLIKVDRSSRVYTYTFNYELLGLTDEGKHVTDDIAYLFSNALFNTRTYTEKYKIKSWTTIGLALEAALKVSYSSPYVSLAPSEIQSVTGAYSNKATSCKNLINLGFIQEKKSVKRTHQYKLNKRAYLLGSN